MKEKHTAWLLLVLLLAAGAAAGCKSKPEENCGGGVDSSGEDAVICTDKTEYEYGEIVHLRFTLANRSAKPMRYNGGSEPAMDICEVDVCWSDGQELTPDLTQLVLEPGQSRTIEWTWPPSQEYLNGELPEAKSGFAPPHFYFIGYLRRKPDEWRPSSVDVGIWYEQEEYKPFKSRERLLGYCESGVLVPLGLALEICTDKGRYRPDETAHVRWRITNRSREQVVLDGLGEAAAMDIHVAGERWSDGRELTPALTRLVLEPGASHTVEWDWPTPQTELGPLLESGAYQDFSGELLATIGLAGEYMRRPGDRWRLWVRIRFYVEEQSVGE